MSFNRENLHVYQRALGFAERAISHSTEWDTKHAIQDHLPRAAASILENIAMARVVLNIAEGNGRFSTLEQRRFLATSHEATVKLAARLDLCVAQGVILARALALEPSVPDPRIVLVDESHRSQYGKVHAQMQRVRPNACYIGFMRARQWPGRRPFVSPCGER